MDHFIQRCGSSVIGVLNGFDRLRFRGTLRMLAHAGGLFQFLYHVQVLLKDFGKYVESVSRQVSQAACQVAESQGRPMTYLNSCTLDKEALAREVAERDGVTQGLVGVWSCVEPCRSYQVVGNREKKELELRSAWRKCRHYYFYYQHPQVGWMYARLQSWFPFGLHVGINGREWLSRQMDAIGLGYTRRDNCFVNLADAPAAQQLLDQQLRTSWVKLLQPLADQVHPTRRSLLAGWGHGEDYYWSLEESEWASDVLFRSPADLSARYPHWIRQAMTTFGSREVMRFLGRKVPQHGGVHGRFAGEVISDLRQRPEGMRIKHRLNRNSIKMYDKQGTVLRVETTINDPRDMKVRRSKEGDPTGPKSWRRLRKGVADVRRRAQLSQAANERYLDGLAAVESVTPLRELTDRLCRPTVWQGKRVRALNPLAADDSRLLEAVARGEFALQGFRNKDLRCLLYGSVEICHAESRRQSGAITRRLRLLRAHGLIKKVNQTHLYRLTDFGQRAITALLAARQANTEKLLDAA